MASLPKSATVNYEEWLNTPEVEDATEEVVNGEIRIMPLIEQDGYIHSAPQLLVEVWSPANTRGERAEKLADYGSLGVPEGWMFFPERRNVEVFDLENGSLRQSQVLTEGILKPTRFPGVQVDISGIWPA